MATERAKPYPKSTQLARGERRHARKAASPQTWQRIIDTKLGPCRVCVAPGSNGHDYGVIEFHHIVARVHGGGDEPDNIVPLHRLCHSTVTQRRGKACANLLCSLTDAEYAYMVTRGGEDYAERAYGIRYAR